MSSREYPTFAIVGHPNKGKSSIVSALAQDERVSIGRDPGTTKDVQNISLNLRDKILYQLVDTPGFQRPRKALAWLKKRAGNASSHPEVVKQFVDSKECAEFFPDEVKLLTPIVNGAGIIYVVDGSTPYGEEYDAELEILRWSGAPSMALINPIGGEEFVQQWRVALGQFFNLVKVFNAKSERFEKHVELLTAMELINESWRASLAQAKKVLTEDREQKYLSAASEISEMITQMLSLELEDKLSEESKLQEIKDKLTKEILVKIQALEASSREQIEKILSYNSLERSEELLKSFDQTALFSKQSFRLFGLSRKDILTYSAIGGAAAGSLVDIASGGGSLLSGSLFGGLIGFGTAFFGAEKLLQAKVLSLPLGEKIVRVGPIKDINFPHVVLNRARLHFAFLLSRTHANRDRLDLNSARKSLLKDLAPSVKSKLEREFRKIRHSAERSDVLVKLILEILIDDKNV